jgi:hypothetical protein
MALTDKDILITPNDGSASANPKIEFTGADANGNDTITVDTQYDGSITTLSYEGSAGQLFSISNDLTGTLFAVNDSSGVPSLEIDNNGEIKLSEFDGTVTVGNISAAPLSGIFGGRLIVKGSGDQDPIIAITDSASANSAAGVFHQSSSAPGFPALLVNANSNANSQAIISAKTNVSNTSGTGGTEVFKVTGQGALTITGQLTASTVNTGQGATEVHLMNQNVRTTDSPTFATVNTGQGANELYAMNQNVRSTDNVIFNRVTVDPASGGANFSLDRSSTSVHNNLLFYTGSALYWRLWQSGANNSLAIRNEATTTNVLSFTDNESTFSHNINAPSLNTGHGDNELYPMNQAVRTSDSPTFQDLTVQGNLSITGDINSYNVTDLDVTDKTITVGSGQTEANSGGSGLIVDGSGASLLWDEADNYWAMNKKLAFDSTPTTTNQGLGIIWTGFDKEGTTDPSDSASIYHTTNTGGHGGSVLLISSMNDSGDGIAFSTHGSSYLKHNSSEIITAGNYSTFITSVSNADTVDSLHAASFLRSDANDTATGALTFSNTANHFNGHIYYDAYDSNGNHYPHYLSGSGNNGAQVNLRVQQSGGGGYDVLYIPNGSNNITWRGNTVWNAGNDGSGSGLDADTVDSYHASTTRNSANTIPVRDGNGYLNVGWINTTSGATTNASSEYYVNTSDNYIRKKSLANVRTEIMGVSNGGSFLRSDTLDVMTYNTTTGEMLKFANNTSGGIIQLGFQQNDTDGMHHRAYLKVWKGSASASGNVDLIVRGSGGGLTSDVLSLRSGNASPTWRGQAIWNAGNDGSGSGLDADLLDGVQGASYLRSDVDDTLTGNLQINSHVINMDLGNINDNAIDLTSVRASTWPFEFTTHSVGNDNSSGFWVGSNGYPDMRLRREDSTVRALISSWETSYVSNGFNINGNTAWHAGNDGSGSGLDADTLDGYHKSDINPAHSHYRWTGIAASGTQARRFVIMRLYACPAHWDSNWQDIHFKVWSETYEATNLKYEICGDYAGAGTQATMFKLRLKDAGGSSEHGRFRLVLGTPVDAGWDYSGADTYYVDVYAEASHYMNFTVAADFYSAGFNVNTLPTSGGATTVVYSSPTVSNITTFNEAKEHSYFANHKIWNDGNHGSASGLDADLLDGQHGSYYYAASNPNGYTSNVGDITGVTAGNGLTGGGSSGTPTLNVGSGSGISVAADTVGVDSSVIRTTGAQSMSGVKTHTSRLALSAGQMLSLGDTNHHLVKVSTGYSGATVDGPRLQGHQGGELATNIGSNQYSLRWDGSGNITVRNNVNVLNDIVVGTYSTTNSGNLYLTGSTANKQAVLKCTNGNLHMDANAGNNLYLNYYTGNGTYFGTGATGVAAVMGPDGDLWKGSSDNAGSKYWHAGNDASGSGLDADLLDGQHGSYYAPASHVHSYLPINNPTATGTLISPIIRARKSQTQGNYTTAALWTESYSSTNTGIAFHISGNVGKMLDMRTDGHLYWENGRVWSATSDGSGSGLDADLLDGQHGSYYAPASHGHSYLPLTGGTLTGNVTFQDDNEGITFNGGGRFYKQSGQGLVIRKPSGGQELRFEDNSGTFIGTFWHSGNDGASSGLDADLLDGQHGSYYMPASTTSITESHRVSGNAFATTGSPGSVLEYQQASGQTDTKLAPSTDWYNTIRMGHGNPYSYYSSTIAMQMTGTGYGQIKTQSIQNNTAAGWRTQWDSSNDGSGSGLDADLLDGQNGSYYAPASHVHSYLPLSGGTLTGNLNGTTASFSGKVDFQGDAAIEGGSGYGVFKGYTGNSNHFIVVRGSVANQTGLSITGAHQTTFVEHAENNDTSGWFFKSNQTGSYAEIARITRTGGMHLQGSKVWHAGNDGSGSGLDADLLDGQQGSYYAPASHGHSYLPLTGGTLTGGLQVNGALGALRSSTNGAIWFTGTVDVNHALWNDYYGGPATKGAANSGFDGMRWNAYRGLRLKGGAGGAYNCLIVENSGGANNDHTVKLYASNVLRLSTTTSGVTVAGTLLVDDKIMHTGDTDTYMSFDAADQWKLYCGGYKMIQATEASSGYDYVSFGGTTNSGEILFNVNGGDGHFDGDIYAFSTTTSSDRKLKKNIQSLEGSLEKVLGLRGVSFEWKKNNKKSIGFIAQEVQEVVPDLVKNNRKEHDGVLVDEHLGVDYGNVTALLVEAMKEQQQIINKLEARLKALETGEK